MDQLYNRMRDPAAYRIRAEDAVSGSLDLLRGHKYGVLVSFRRTGVPVPSPIWMAVDSQGRAYVQTGRRSGKIKRIRNDSRVLMAASNVRGKPKGPVLSGTARILPMEEWAHAESTLASAFGLDRRLYLRVFHMSDDVLAYLEIAPLDTF
jgi:hypothetical protein